MVKKAIRYGDPKSIDMKEYEAKSPAVWAIRNVKLPKGAPWDFEHRAWQFAIFDDPSNDLVVIKPTQIGMTTVMLAKMLHFATFNSVRAMYTLPRQDDVYDLVNGRLERMFADSPTLAARVGSVDNVRLKTYGRSYLHFMESSVPPRMLDVDFLVNDEVDISNQDHLEQYVARLDASDYDIRIRISSPTITNFGIDAAYQDSTQNTWLVKCPSCNKDQELDWDASVQKKNGELFLTCQGCGRILTPEIVQAGRWVPKFPSRDISGYSVSQLMVTSIPLSKLQRDFETMRTKNFYNLRLGKAYASSSGGFTRESLLDNCFTSEHDRAFYGSGYFIGADQGNDIHVVVGKKVDDKVNIVYMEVIPLEQGFDRLAYLFTKYNARKMVVDGLPNRHSALSLVNKIPGGRGRVAFYTQLDKMYKEVPEGNQVNINRTISFDSFHNLVNSGKVQFYGKRTSVDNVTRLAISHILNMKRDEVSSKTTFGGEKIEIAWVNTGADHFAHAINYMLIAADSSSGGSNSLRAGNLNDFGDRDDSDNHSVYNNNPYASKAGILKTLERNRRRSFIK